MVEVFVAQNPDRPRPSRPAQIGLKPSSSRTTEAFGQSRPELYRHVTTLLAQRLHDTNDALATNFLSVKGRVARALLSLAEAFGRNIGQGRILIQQKVSQGDLAAMAGIARKNVSRVLHNWANGSLVTRLAGYYCLEEVRQCGVQAFQRHFDSVDGENNDLNRGFCVPA